MIENRISEMNSYFDEQIAACAQRGKKLAADDRGDEATFEKVKANVLDIFRTILSVAVKMGRNDPEKIRQFFVQKTKEIPANWVTAYRHAEQHGDAVKMQIEKIKIDMIEEIKVKFAEVWEAGE